VGELDRANLKEGQGVLIQLDAIPRQKIKGVIKSMSGTAKTSASAGDPAKKFDVVFSLDMKQLFTLLGVKPRQIERIQTAAEANERSAESAPNARQYSAKELENARLPRAPEEGEQFEVLLRPGLLADIEVIGERLQNAVHIPAQAVFEKNGRSIVYVRQGDIFEARPFTLLQRTESVAVSAKGLEPGEVVALSDPTRKRDSKDQKSK